MTKLKLITNLKVALLTAIVIGAFIFSSLGWRHIKSSQSTRIIVGSCILLLMYGLMIFELINRNLAALIGAVASIAAYDCLVKYAEMGEILQWEDLETLALLFGMMIIVNVLKISGLFDFLAIWTYKIAGGRFWLLISTLAFFTAILSAFIDNVSSMLLLSPTLIKLSELEHIDPRFMLLIMVIFCNIGGTATPIGDPPNLIIIGDPFVSSLNINFSSFTAICAPGVLISMLVILLYLRLVYKSKNSFKVFDKTCESSRTEVIEKVSPNTVIDETKLNKELELLCSFSTKLNNHDDVLSEETSKVRLNINEQILLLEDRVDILKRKKRDELAIDFVAEGRRGSRLTESEIDELMKVYSIKSMPILIISLIVLLVAVVLFFVQSLPGINLTLGWISLFAGLTLLVLVSSIKMPKMVNNGPQDNDDNEEENFDRVIKDVEWSTLMFFFALFIVMEAMAKLGVIRFMGEQVTHLIDMAPSGQLRSIAGITIILWASAIASACVDNVPFTSIMVKILGTMIVHARDSDSGTLVRPLVFALAFGACFGGNATIIGASANLITTGASSRYGYPITFGGFFKFAAPITFISLIIVNIYLVVVFVVLGI